MKLNMTFYSNVTMSYFGIVCTILLEMNLGKLFFFVEPGKANSQIFFTKHIKKVKISIEMKPVSKNTTIQITALNLICKKLTAGLKNRW